MSEAAANKPQHFIQQIIANDIKNGKHGGKVVTRFPPEPNGYLHIGHAKAITIDFGMAAEFGGRCHLRFDDTNPAKESVEYVDSIQEDVRWLGYDWGKHLYYTSDYFQQLYDYAVQLIQLQKAYVCDMTAEEVAAARGTPTQPGKHSPFRTRSVEENLDLFTRMRAGEFADGTKTLRAKIDMTSPNMHMRDPALYRIRKVHHHRTGDAWPIYPMYDFAHCLSDAIEGITHSMCSLEFEVHRPLYDWLIAGVDAFPSKQYEFARLNLSYTVMSKRKLLQLVEENYVSGWDDPRMPTLSGLRRRGYTPEVIRNFCEIIGVTKFNGITDIALLEHCLRDHLNKVAPRVMAVMDPLKVVIENYPAEQIEQLDAVNNPEDESAGMRKVPFTRELYIERDDFMEDAPKKFFRLAPGREVRLRYAYYITCTDVIKDAAGNIVELRCTYDPETKGGQSADGRKVKGTLHWVSATEHMPAQVRLYDRLFTVEQPDAAKEQDFKTFLNPDSLQTKTAYVEPSMRDAVGGTRVQFERVGYFCVDSKDTSADGLVFNRTVPLRDSWTKKK